MAAVVSVLYRLVKIAVWIVVFPLALVFGVLMLLITGINWCLYYAESWAEGKDDEPPFLWALWSMLNDLD